MKKFVFNLEKVMDFKNQNLESKKGEHARAIAALNEQQRKIDSIYEKYNSVNSELNKKKSSGISIIEMSAYMSFLHVLEKKIQEETQFLNELKNIENEKRIAVVNSKVETSTLERLRQTQYEQYLKAVQKSEELFIEEFVSRQRTVSQ